MITEEDDLQVGDLVHIDPANLRDMYGDSGVVTVLLDSSVSRRNPIARVRITKAVNSPTAVGREFLFYWSALTLDAQEKKKRIRKERVLNGQLQVEEEEQIAINKSSNPYGRKVEL